MNRVSVFLERLLELILMLLMTALTAVVVIAVIYRKLDASLSWYDEVAVSYTHLRAHETEADLVCRLLLEKKK